MTLIDRERPDVAIVDVRMPPTHTTEGLEAARQIRLRHPGTAILVLSQYVETRYALELLRDDPAGIGYLLKDRVTKVADLADAVRRVAAGGSVIDPEVVSRLLGRPRAHSPLDELTPREREILGLMAEGRSNQAIADRWCSTPRRSRDTSARSSEARSRAGGGGQPPRAGGAGLFEVVALSC